MAKTGKWTKPDLESITGWYDNGWEAEDPVSEEDHEAIARLAYSHWEARGCPIGSPEEDWYRSANELRKPIAATAGA